jgi:L-cysteine:1D-myo-inositol 2-amino-2-deoxy-alpha-D-glucopyranoside ligase
MPSSTANARTRPGAPGLRVYNSLSRSVEPLALRGATAGLYVCGITPYDTTHLGHAFTYAAFDVLVRYLEWQGVSVRYTQNVTDVDDDILRRAAETGEDWQELGDRWTEHFARDMQALNVRSPDHFPRATQTIPDILAAIERLLAAGVAYARGGSVYFRAAAWPGFGRLSRLPPGERLAVANQHGNRPDDPNKADPLDFVLWQAAAPGEPEWPSPWGPGRPGWHIECTALARRFLTQPVDIHGGGADLLFPHHECELAQAEAAGGEPFVRAWMHTAMVRHEGEKMSKSLGNLVMVHDLLQGWSADGLRLGLARQHYRREWSYAEAELAQAERQARRWRSAVEAASGDGPVLDAGPAALAFTRAMDDDLDTPEAVCVLDGLAEAILKAAAKHGAVGGAQTALAELAGVLGLRLAAGGPEPRVLAGWDERLKQFRPSGRRQRR